MKTVNGLTQLADLIGAHIPTVEAIARRVYKDTDCGASFSLVNHDGHIKGVKVGSIVEGCDAEVRPIELLFPFTDAQWEEAIAYVEREADYLYGLYNENNDQ